MVSVILHNGNKIEAELADTHLKRMNGLSGAKEKKSLLFVFPISMRWSFWMPNMKFPISIIYLNKNKEVVDIKEATPLTVNPKTWKTYKSSKACKFVLETPFEHNIKIGSVLNW